MCLWRLFLATVGVLLLVLAPSADVVAFGLHEHETVERSFDLTGAESTQGPTLFHHCELSVSVGELIPAAELPTPIVVMGDPPDPRASSPQHTPFVLLTPPRT